MDGKIDIVLLGATGYTGRLCAAYMAQALPEDVSWAIAGRSESKLQDLHKELKLEESKCLLYPVPFSVNRLLNSLYRQRVRSRLQLRHSYHRPRTESACNN